MKAFEAGTKHSYCVCDELRASAFVFLELLDVVIEWVRVPPVLYFIGSAETPFRQNTSLKVIQFYGSQPQPFLHLLCDGLWSCKTFTANLEVFTLPHLFHWTPLGLVHQPTTAKLLVPVPVQSEWSPSGIPVLLRIPRIGQLEFTWTDGTRTPLRLPVQSE